MIDRYYVTDEGSRNFLSEQVVGREKARSKFSPWSGQDATIQTFDTTEGFLNVNRLLDRLKLNEFLKKFYNES